MDERCDHFPNCDDYSDEADCHLVLTPENYHEDYAPFRFTDGKLMKVPVKVKVCYIYLKLL